MSEEKELRQINTLVDPDDLEIVKEEYPHGTLSEEIRTAVSALADGVEYEPDVERETAIESYEKKMESDTYPEDWRRRREQVLLRDGYQCQNCKAHGNMDGAEDLVVHHIVPVVDGGTHYITNLVTLCEDCHNRGHEVG